MKTLLQCVMLSACLVAGQAARAEEAAGLLKYSNGLAAGGYDVVAYFSENKATPGSSEHSAKYGGQEWRFSSAKNRDAFVSEPHKYVPQYGGHCAFAAAQNALAFGDPKAWTVRKSRLYFNYNAAVRSVWKIGAAMHIANADRLWPELARRAENQR